jgi:hypothetical protein
VTERRRDTTATHQRPGEIVEMPPEERARRLTALWKRLMDPDGFDRDALATIEGPTHGDQ